MRAHTKMSELPILFETPAVDEYCAMRAVTGLSPKTAEAASQGLPGTLFAVCIRDGDELIGMGRVIGDGGLNYEIVDMAVHPDYQRQGHGYRIMEALMSFVRESASESAYVCLLADDGAPALYKKFGFEFTAPRTVGMALIIK